MSSFGVIATRLDINSRSLKEFDESLHSLRTKQNKLKSEELSKIIKIILNIVLPISEGINDTLSSSEISENSILNILKERHEKDWQRYQARIQDLKDKLISKNPKIDKDDLSLLEDIADALDAECEYLFQRLSEWR
jgi:hypothetical protein